MTARVGVWHTHVEDINGFSSTASAGQWNVKRQVNCAFQEGTIRAITTIFHWLSVKYLEILEDCQCMCIHRPAVTADLVVNKQQNSDSS